MPVELNHTIVPARDRWESAEWLAELLDLDPPQPFGPFVGVQVGPTALDYIDHDFSADGEPPHLHYAFLVDEEQFSRTFERLVDRAIPYYADPGGHQAQQINTHDGGRGCYFPDPVGHWMEIITVPYGGWPADHAAGDPIDRD